MRDTRTARKGGARLERASEGDGATAAGARPRGIPSDTPYVRTFMKQLAPAWLDHVALLTGFAPPERANGFAWCELGCGQGITPAVLAAAHPGGRFHGVDVMADHIDHARRFAAEAGVANVTFHAADFAEASRLDLPKFDYIVAHGVYTWIDAAAQRALIGFIDRHLAPGGLVYLGYNALPGWSRDLALRQILLEFGRAAPGDSLAQIEAALSVARGLHDAGARALESGRVGALAALDKHYLAHEYLVRESRPLFVTEVRAAVRAIGLVPVGSAYLVDNYDRFVLRAAARKVLDRIADDDLRELARDCCTERPFRSDVFAREAERIDDAERVRRLMASRFMLARPAAAVAFRAETPSGKLKFENDGARQVVAELGCGPSRLVDIRRGSVSRRDILANVLTLSAAGELWPVDSFGEAPVALIEAIFRRLDGPEEILILPLSNGAALTVPKGLLRRLRDGRPLDNYPGWQDYLISLGGPGQV